MEYISAEEFLKQPKEVQATFLNWWKPSVGDICAYKVGHSGFYSWYMSCITCVSDIKGVLHEIPLLTEGQLRQFIEDKTGCKLFIEYYNGSDILIRFMKDNKETKSHIFYDCNDLLQAYWKVAIKIAKEGI